MLVERMSNLLSSLSPFDSSSLWESLFSTVFIIGLEMCPANRNTFLFLFPSSPKIHRSYTLGTDAGSLSCGAERSVSWQAALPFLPGSVFPQHKSFFLFGCSELWEKRAEWEGGSSGLSAGRQERGVGESRCGWKRCSGEPFEGERKFSYFRDMLGGVAGIHSGG